MKRFVAALWVAGLLLAVLCCWAQFSFDNFVPFAAAGILLFIIWRYRPALKFATGMVAGLSLLAFLLDCTVLHHRLAVESRSWSPVWDGEDVVDILRSPSGRSTAYIVGGGFPDSAYWAYVSDGGLFPKHCYIDTGPTDACYPKDFSAAWSGSVFAVAGVHYDEATSQLTTANQ